MCLRACKLREQMTTMLVWERAQSRKIPRQDLSNEIISVFLVQTEVSRSKETLRG